MSFRRAICAVLLAGAGHLAAANYYVSVAGLGGEPEYDTQFAKWSSDLDKELKTDSPDVHVISLSGAAATRQHLGETLRQIASTSTADDTFALFLIGHGTFDGEDYKFNLPGPDVTARELAGLVDHIPARRQLIVNMTSCSGASLTALARKDRVVITATKSGTEKNAPVFARYWVDSLRDPAADTDKNGTVSAQEAFNYAQRKTTAYFETEKLMATEHPLLTDIAKPEIPAGSTANVNRPSALAAAFPLVRPQANVERVALPGKQRLLTRKEELEARIDKLKFEKAAMDPDAYRQQITALLLELARTQAEIDK